MGRLGAGALPWPGDGVGMLPMATASYPYAYSYWGYPYDYAPIARPGDVKIENAAKDDSVYIDGGYSGTVNQLKKFQLDQEHIPLKYATALAIRSIKSKFKSCPGRRWRFMQTREATDFPKPNIAASAHGNFQIQESSFSAITRMTILQCGRKSYLVQRTGAI